MKFLEKQTQKQKEKILKAIKNLPNSSNNVKKLSGYDKRYRLRVGAIRVIYEINNDELIIIVINIGNRGDIYKKI